jgi:hypothetical protein
MDSLSVLRANGIFMTILVCLVVIWYIFPFWCIVPRKIWQPCKGAMQRRPKMVLPNLSRELKKKMQRRNFLLQVKVNLITEIRQ